MFVRYRSLVGFIIFISCTNEFFPEKLYDYQVERLLSGGGSKEWSQVVNSEACQDSVRLLIELVSSAVDDSVSISQIVNGISCNPDTTFIGNADASSFPDAIIFTDSLNFANGNTWIIGKITSSQLQVLKPTGFVHYSGN